MNVMTILGARPQFIKAAPVSRAFAAASGITESIVHTGQHFDTNMSAVFFGELGIPAPASHLGIAGGTHGAMTGRMLVAIEETMLDMRPDLVLVYGDTNSTLAGALVGAKLGIPVAHVEAGLRSFNRAMPEEINRIAADRVSRFLFTPTDAATANLRTESVNPGWIHQVGDVMYDAALYHGAKAEAESGILGRLGLEARAYVLATVHRQENTDDPARLAAILEGLRAVAASIEVVVPLHPRTRQALERIGADRDIAGLTVTDPVGYLDMVMLERNAIAIVTDSGGVQKEAFFHRVPCVTVRDETEWLELVELGWNRLAPPGRSDLRAIVEDAIGSRGKDGGPYGDGDAAGRIADILLEVD